MRLRVEHSVGHGVGQARRDALEKRERQLVRPAGQLRQFPQSLRDTLEPFLLRAYFWVPLMRDRGGLPGRRVRLVLPGRDIGVVHDAARESKGIDAIAVRDQKPRQPPEHAVVLVVVHRVPVVRQLRRGLDLQW